MRKIHTDELCYYSQHTQCKNLVPCNTVGPHQQTISSIPNFATYT